MIPECADGPKASKGTSGTSDCSESLDGDGPELSGGTSDCLDEPIPREDGVECVESDPALDVGEFDRQMLALGAHLARMELTRKEMLRATPARHVLWRFGKTLRAGPFAKSQYQLSSEVKQVRQFWSHSWHGNVWAKICLLFVVSNGMPALLISSLLAMSAPVLFLHFTGQSGTLDVCWIWWIEQCLGSLICGFTFLLWQPGKKIFLDKICIHQSNTRLKMEGLLNVCAVVKHSKSMLVCWDTTYVQRLWCVLEMAAALKAHGRTAKLIIRPVSWAPMVIVSFVGMSILMVVYTSFQSCYVLELFPALSIEYMLIILFVVFVPLCVVTLHLASGALRAHFRAVDTMQEQLRHFSLDFPKCHCCTLNHINPKTGEPLPCDRLAIGECIRSWFGSVADFETLVQEQVADVLAERLVKNPFPYFWLVGATTPVVWTHLSKSAVIALSGDWYILNHMYYILCFWLAAIPVMVLWWARVVQVFKRKRHHRWQDFLVNVACSFCLAGIYVLFSLVDGLTVLYLADGYGYVFGSMNLILLAFTYLGSGACSCKLKHV